MYCAGQVFRLPVKMFVSWAPFLARAPDGIFLVVQALGGSGDGSGLDFCHSQGAGLSCWLPALVPDQPQLLQAFYKRRVGDPCMGSLSPSVCLSLK